MRLKIALFLTLSLFVSTCASPVFAEDGTTSAREKAIQERQQLRQEIKDKFAAIKDVRKKALVEKIDQKMATLNQKRTEQMTEHLQKLTAVLNRLKNKAPDLPEIASAEKAIAAAQTAVTAQTAKTYTAQIASEETLRANLGNQVKTLEADLKSVRQLVQTAHQSVITALQGVKKLGGARGQSTITPAATISD
jgi:ABC-type transport system involved in cytochrome bd biosynthesis fused ATPase/permease subunit